MDVFTACEVAYSNGSFSLATIQAEINFDCAKLIFTPHKLGGDGALAHSMCGASGIDRPDMRAKSSTLAAKAVSLRCNRATLQNGGPLTP
jgi:hypothetical protein